MFGRSTSARSSGLVRVLSGVALLGMALVARPAVAQAGDPPVLAAAFVDLNADGQWQAGEVAFTGLEVRAFDDAGGVAVGVLNAATSQFSIDVSGLSGSRFRVEYSNVAAPYQWGAQGTGSDLSLRQSGTSTQFVDAGGMAVVAVDNPATFCQDNPALATNCYVAGNQLSDLNASRSTLVGVGYDWGNTIKDPSNPFNPVTGGVETIGTWQVNQAGAAAPPRSLALASQIGSTWGEAWDRNTNYLYVSSYLKQFAGYGPEGPNAIYRVPMDPYTGQASGAPELFARVGNSTGRDAGGNPATFAATGGTDGVSVCNDLHGADLSSPVYEDAVFANVMKCSFGDMDISEDGSRLYVTSLKGKEILEFDTSTGQMVAQHPVPVGDTTAFCPNVNVAADVWPFGLGLKGTDLFVGGVCSALTSGNSDDAWMWVMKMDVATGTWSQVINFNTREWRQWNYAWIDSYQAFRDIVFPGGIEYTTADSWDSTPGAQITDIEFFGNDLTLGVRDRGGDQMGYGIPDPLDPNPNTSEREWYTTVGDLICVWWDSASSSYVREANGSCGAARKWQNPLNGQDPASYPDGGPGQGDQALPDMRGQEFYWGDGANDVYRGNPATGAPWHQEPSFGGLSQVNSGPLAFTALNPPDALGGELTSTGGIGWADSTNGSTYKAYLIYQTQWTQDIFANAYFGKSNGLGDLEELCVRAPVEIGNRLWFDADGDGLQDPGELPVVGATVDLYSSAGVKLGSVVTDSLGRYVFRSVGPDGLSGNADDLFRAGDVVTVRVDNPTDFASGGVLSGWFATQASVVAPVPAGGDVQNSDGVVGNTLGLAGSSVLLASASETAVTVGGPGVNDHTYDFGFVQSSYSLGNQVWNDLNNNGLIDAGESGVDGVTVNLYLDANGDGVADGPAVGTQVTSNGGFYLFTGLAAGTYLVEAVLPSGFVSSTGSGAVGTGGTYEPAPAANTDIDADDNGTTVGSSVWSSDVVLGSGEPLGEPATPGLIDTAPDGQSNLTVDFGIYRPYSIGNVVWNDLNNNGVQDSGEPGIDGVTVRLLDALGNVLQTTTTATGTVAGEYMFTGLPAGGYIVEIVPGPGFVSSTGTSNAYEPAPDPNNDVNLDDNGTFNVASGTIRSGVVTLGPGDEPVGEEPAAGDPPDASYNKTVDFGIFQTLSLGDLVWSDLNDNGVVDAGEPGVDGVTVNLYSDPDGNGVFDTLVGTTTTANGGLYSFSNLLPGDYQVGFVLPTDFRSSTDVSTSADPNNDVNSDDNVVGTGTGEVRTATVTLAAGSEPTNDGDSSAMSNLSIDAGIFNPNAAVTLKKYTNGCDAQIASGAVGPTAGCPADNGQNNPIVNPGGTVTWTYVVTNTGNVPLTAVTVTDDKVAASSIVCDTDNVVDTLAVGATVTCTASGTAVAGQYENTGSVTATGETTPGVVEPLAPVTDPSHYYGANPGLTLKKYTNLGATLETNPVDDADVAGGTDGSANHVVALGTAVTWRYVVTNTGNVSLDNVTVTDDKGGAVTCPKTTLAAGESMTCELAGVASTAGQYTNIGTVTATDPSGSTPGQLTASDPSNMFVTSSSIDVIKYTNGVDADTQAEGPQVGLGSTVTWTYVVHNTGNTWLTSIALTDDKEGAITCPATVLAPDDGAVGGPDEMTCTHTGTAVKGDYANVATVTGVPSGPDGTPIPGVPPVTDNNPSHYTGIVGSIGDTVWEDTNADGIQDVGEPPIPGVTVILLDDSGKEIGRTTTDQNGNYLFTDLPPGNYTVTFEPPPGYVISTPAQGVDVSLDSNPDPTTGVTPIIPLAPGETNLTIDAGMYRPVSVGDLVWFDTNNNGVVDAGEAGIDGILVTLYADLDGDGVFSDVVGTQTTSDAGHYLFTGLKPGDYQIGVGVPAGFVSSTGGGSEPAPDVDIDMGDNDDNGTTTGVGQVRSETFTLVGNEPLGEPAVPGHSDTVTDDRANYTVDFGFTQPVSLGDTVFYDTNDNGVQDTGEVGAAGVTVELMGDPDGDGVFDTVIDTTVTDQNGNYLFDQLLPGTYVVQITAPTDYRSSTDPATGGTPDNDVNGDDNGTGTGVGTIVSGPVTLVAGAEPINDGDSSANSNLSVDFGLFDPNPGYTIKKYTNGCDAQLATGQTGPATACPADDGQNNPVIATGAPVTWTYVVVNTGNVSLTDITVTDSDPNVDVSCPTDTLAAGATLTCTATGTAVTGQYQNTGTVTATGETTPGQPPAVLPPVTDDSHYFASNPGLTLKKYSNLGSTLETTPVDDADTPGGADPTANHVIAAGTAITWRYVVTNTGNVTINDIKLVDDKAGDVTCPKTSLAAGETMTCEKTGTVNTPGQYTNIGTVTGTTSDNKPLTATDPSHVFVAASSIEVIKLTNNVDADTPSEAVGIAVGATVTWTYQVHNTGNVALTNVTVTDDKEGPITCPTTTLAADDNNPGGPDEMVCTKTGVAQKGPYTNNATVTGTPTDPTGKPIDPTIVPPPTDQNPSNYTGVPIVIGDTIWLDTNTDGAQTPGEPGIGGVTLEIVDETGTVVGTTTTDTNGHYQFDDTNVDGGLKPDTTYTIHIPDENYKPNGPLDGLTPTKPNTVDTSIDSNIIDAVILVRTPTDGGQDMTYDGGYIPKPADVQIVKEVASNSKGIVTYTLTIKNNGPNTVRGPIQVVDTPPAELKITSGTGEGWTCTINTTLNCSRPDNLQNGETAPVITVIAEANQTLLSTANSELTNTATVTTPNSPDTNIANNTDTAAIPLTSVVLDAGITKPTTKQTATPNNAQTPTQQTTTNKTPSKLAITGRNALSLALTAAALLLLGTGLYTIATTRKKKDTTQTP